MRLLGIDPGLNGGVVLLQREKLIESWVIPILLEDNGKKYIDLYRLNTIFKEIGGVDHAFLERVYARPGQGVVSMFSFGQVLGSFEALLVANSINYSMILPQTWRKIIPDTFKIKDSFGKEITKESSIAYSEFLFDPNKLKKSERSKKAHDGFCDAGLIAYWGLKKYRNIGNLSELNDYYVYAYLDPEKPGEFKYGDGIQFDFEPFYIGKGKKARYKEHLKCKRASSLTSKIKSLLKKGKNPIILKFYENLCEYTAFEFESGLIKQIGRKDLGQGPLRNLTDGGEGIKGRIFDISGKNNPFFGKKHSFATRKRISDLAKGREITLKTRKKMSEGQLGRTHTDKTKKAISDSQKGKKLSKEHIEKLKGREVSESTRQKLRETQLGRAHSEETKKKMSNMRKGKKLPALSKSILGKKNPNAKSVSQYTLEGKFLQKYPTIKEAASAAGISSSSICDVLSERGKTAGGFIWKSNTDN